MCLSIPSNPSHLLPTQLMEKNRCNPMDEKPFKGVHRYLCKADSAQIHFSIHTNAQLLYFKIGCNCCSDENFQNGYFNKSWVIHLSYWGSRATYCYNFYKFFCQNANSVWLALICPYICYFGSQCFLDHTHLGAIESLWAQLHLAFRFISNGRGQVVALGLLIARAMSTAGFKHV